MCAILGMIGVANAGALTAAGLGPMQHRGPQGGGVVSRHEGKFHSRRAVGTLSQVFPGSMDVSTLLPGDAAVGHLRYATTGKGDEYEGLQPMKLQRLDGTVAFAHNGNLLHYNDIRAGMERQGKAFRSWSDTELLLHYWAESQGASSQEKFVDACSRADGAWSLVTLTDDCMIAACDPFGIRPLVLGRIGNGVVAASETCALDAMDVEVLRYVEPGEVVTIANDGTIASTFPFEKPGRTARCSFELVYFLAPHSRVPTPFGIRSAQHIRTLLGAALARNMPPGIEIDSVIAVPDSANAGALGFAQEAGLPFSFGIIRSHTGQSPGRSFTEPTPELRQIAARRKTGIVYDAFEGKSVLLFDDSIVRGTTLRGLIRRVRKAKPRAVHVASMSPQVRHSCHLGIDTPTEAELIANQMGHEELRAYLDADSVIYQRNDVFEETLGDVARNYFCTNCFSGEWPIPAGYLLRKNRP